VTLTKALLKNPFSVRTGLRSRTSWGIYAMYCYNTTTTATHQEKVDMTGMPLFLFIQFKFSMTSRDDPTFASQH
jgi:hypothetical protein